MTQRILISLPKALLEELDAYAKAHRYNRSELIRHAVREIINRSDNESTE